MGLVQRARESEMVDKKNKRGGYWLSKSRVSSSSSTLSSESSLSSTRSAMVAIRWLAQLMSWQNSCKLPIGG